ncbi:hypothetical protein NW762_013850 [Fusarium torreyae]|uniref:NACHT domain-containing protein n=1 Tax=Fusarium torreyae TaxID=1237075 RepID=A0A9W8RLA0_9HYPO|nr:hypothetical protein NW762_013850 [Fusarium torreyae]
MALLFREASRLKPELRLAQAVSEFKAALTSEQKASFIASQNAAASNGPTVSDVMSLVADIEFRVTSRHGRVQGFGQRLAHILVAIQTFAALGDVVVGGSQNLIACGVWAAARMTVHVVTGYLTHWEKLSALLMIIGRNAPRYQALAAIYPQSKNLQRYLYEYFIIVTKIFHQSIVWTKKSAIGRLSSTISDPGLKDFQSDLNGWSVAIREEANLLLNQRVDEEVKESAKFRSMVRFGSKTSAHQQKIRRCIRFLDACSQYDYRTTWKQTRKCGTTCLLQSCREYLQWKDGQPSDDSILFHGKLGAGKSVLLANIVDDLNLRSNSFALYFFARHDNSESLKARTILGSLIRQLLENFVLHDDFDHVFVEGVSPLNLDDIVTVFTRVPAHDRRVYIVLDGLDECDIEEQRTVLQHLSWIQSGNYKLCLSVRTPEQHTIWNSQPFQFHASIPEDNPDILDYVQVEVDNRVRDGTLNARDPGLVEDIKQELADRAGGMFLWVALQLDSLCDESSDDAIREAIHDLPRDLTETFERNLTKANSKDSKGHHIRIFKLLVGARQLLTTEELREAASVTVGNAIWNPNQHINNIHAALKFCGSLVMVDEEDDTVRFIHHSARSFCLNSPRNAAEWTFTEFEADKAMAETVVTYLSYNVFDTRLSRNVIPNIDARTMPQKVLLSTMNKHVVRTKFAGKFLAFHSHTRHDIGPVLAEAGSSRWKDDTQEFFFLSYAKKNWIYHTSHLEDLTSVPQWHYLLDHPAFGVDHSNVSGQSYGKFSLGFAEFDMGFMQWTPPSFETRAHKRSRSTKNSGLL